MVDPAGADPHGAAGVGRAEALPQRRKAAVPHPSIIVEPEQLGLAPSAAVLPKARYKAAHLVPCEQAFQYRLKAAGPPCAIEITTTSMSPSGPASPRARLPSRPPSQFCTERFQHPPV